jgi:DNA polymerase I-like protein with 3'-5' exonuclease and polymerase domains
MTDYVLLPKIQHELPEIHLLTLEEFKQRRDMIESFQSGPCGMDYEANNWDYIDPDFKVRTVGLSNDQYTVSIDLKGANEGDMYSFKKWLWLSELEYVAHNVSFEAGASTRLFGSYGNPIADTYVLFADLATEYRRSWSLDTAMSDLLGLTKEGDKVKDHMKANKWTWADIDEFDFEILGRYNAIDAYGHWALYKYFQKIVDSYKDTWGAYYWDYHQNDCMRMVLMEVEARLGGIYVDTEELEKSYEELTTGRDETMEAFLGDPEIAPHIKTFNEECVAEVIAAEPPKLTKTGKVTARYTKWLDKVEAAKKEQHFNTNSTQQLRWLFFDMMRLPVVEYTEKGEPSTAKDVLAKLGKPGQLLLKYREYVTKLKFVTQLREGTNGGKIHPSVRVFGTLSSRSTAGKLEA